jgi:hypothetical protein
MTTISSYIVFAGEDALAQGSVIEVTIAARAAMDQGEQRPILIFDNVSGRQIDFDLRGSEEQIAQRLARPAAQTPRAPGRPKLGVVSREVTLLPRHWEWLTHQRGGASAALRRLVDAERRTGEEPSREGAQQAADRFMTVMAGDRPGYEEATRALYRADGDRFLALTESWPQDIRDHARRLAEPALRTVTAAGTSNPASVGSEAEGRSLAASRVAASPGSAGALLSSQFQIAWALASYHLEDLTTEECLWRPAPRGLHLDSNGVGEWPRHEGYDLGPPSIAWITWHMCFWWRKALEHFRGETSLAFSSVTWPGTATSVRAELMRLCGEWQTSVLARDDLDAPRPASWPLPDASGAEIAAWLNLELMKNAAEIGLVRFLYAVRNAPWPVDRDSIGPKEEEG